MPYSRRDTEPDWFFSEQYTVSGETGTGTTTTCRVLVNALGYEFVSASIIMSKFADELKMSKYEFAEYNRKHPEAGFDKLCDEEIRKAGLRNKVIIEGRLSHIFAPHAWHILNKCPLNKRAERCLSDKSRVSENDTFHTIRHKIEMRDVNDRSRWPLIYPGCIRDDRDFDYILWSDIVLEDAIIETITPEHDLWLKRMKGRIRH